MSYPALCAIFLAIAVIVAVAFRRSAPRGHVVALVGAGVVLVVLTAVFDSVMIATGLFDYADGLISGLRIWLAPLEDFAYPVAALLVCSAVWNALGGDGDGERSRRLRRGESVAARATTPAASDAASGGDA
ncbi:lycopene cyclase domain-containing protein [Agromyces sp. CFH 90414]|uniref:Lycopene cyclase domain-containing protein n=1 Tax=Agromyces agglutinans TaxID=2662258 RepID=A0A6I2FD04_9MICO|nr:lycopene cyclase domain-containing protein [Agromyces agglutinans]MRG59823.1 lycopene cyclase domain-containing protein [Agromyces agglutinans]